jgi:hypothetical protein
LLHASVPFFLKLFPGCPKQDLDQKVQIVPWVHPLPEPIVDAAYRPYKIKYSTTPRDPHVAIDHKKVVTLSIALMCSDELTDFSSHSFIKKCNLS